MTTKRSQLDLRNQASVSDWFAKTWPQAIFLAAAEFGGIIASNTLRAEFTYENIATASSVIYGAHIYKADTLIF